MKIGKGVDCYFWLQMLQMLLHDKFAEKSNTFDLKKFNITLYFKN